MSMISLWIIIAIAVFIIDILSSSFCFVLLAAGSIAAVICAE